MTLSKHNHDHSFKFLNPLEREGLVEEPGQDKGTDKIKEGTVEEDGTHLAPFDFTIIGTTGQEHHV